MVNQPGALFYAKAGSLYVSEPAGSPGRKLTDGPFDTQPAPSPDRTHVAFVRKAKADNYGGELWVLDLSPQLEPIGPPRRLVDPAALPHGSGDAPPMVVSPRWSPTEQEVAFVDNTDGGMVNGGRLLVAAAGSGALAPAPQPPFAGVDFAWAPDGGHIAWVNARSDVRPVDVNILAVGGTSTPIAIDTNAFSVSYSNDGRSLLFTNGDASGPDVVTIPFALRTGGIYSISTASAGPKPPAPTAVLARSDTYYGDVAALDSGAIAFTTGGDQDGSTVIQVLDAGSSVPRTTVTGVSTPGQPPAWGSGDFVAYLSYLDASDETALLVTDIENRHAKQVDTGVDSFAWTR